MLKFVVINILPKKAVDWTEHVLNSEDALNMNLPLHYFDKN